MPAEALHPRRTGHDGAKRRSRANGATSASAGYSPVPEGPSAVDIGTSDTRQVDALSNRVNAELELGPSPNDRSLRVGLAVTAAVAFLLGTALTFISSPDQAVAADTDASTSAETGSNEPVLADSAWQQARHALVGVEVDTCFGPVSGSGFVTTANHALVYLSAAPSAPATSVIIDGVAVSGQVVGWSDEHRVAAVALDEPVADTARWVSANNAPAGSRLELAAESSGWQPQDAWLFAHEENALGVVAGVQLSSAQPANATGSEAASVGDAEDVPVLPVGQVGDVVLTEQGDVIGWVVDREQGTGSTRDQLSPVVGQLLTNANWTPSACLVEPTPETDPAGVDGDGNSTTEADADQTDG